MDVIQRPPVNPDCQQKSLLVPELLFCCMSSRAGGVCLRLRPPDYAWGGFTLKNCFLSTLRRRNLKKEQSLFWICVWRNLLGQGNQMIVGTASFSKAPFQNVFPYTWKRKAGVFKVLRFKERFRKVPFSWRIINNYWMRFLWYPE